MSGTGLWPRGFLLMSGALNAKLPNCQAVFAVMVDFLAQVEQVSQPKGG